MECFRPLLARGGSAAFIIRKGGLTYDQKAIYRNDYHMRREEVIRRIAEAAGEDTIIASTGKISRELFEFRTLNGQIHSRDFLTVGSMGHASSIALGIALQQPEKRVWCLDGDGAALMHMGAMAVIGSFQSQNLIHVILNNDAHETVGGMPTAAKNTDFSAIAKACGYPWTASVETFEELEAVLAMAKKQQTLCFLEVKCAIGARADLGRPTITPQENKDAFMRYLKSMKENYEPVTI